MTETTITTPSWVQALDKYVASKPIEDVAADLGLKPEEIIMLVANENPNGMSSKVKEAVATAALNLNRYPDADAYHLQKAIAERYGVSQDTLRYYEKSGLVPEVTRTAGGIRDYQPDDLGWLELALCMRSAGLPVSGIVEYRKLFQQGESTIPQRLKLLTDQREELLSMKNQIEQTLNRLNYKISVYERATKTGILSWDEEEKCSGDCDG